MDHNDLSNRSAPVILFDFDSIVCTKVTRRFGRYKYELNPQVVAALGNLFRRDFTVVFVTFKWPDKKIDELEQELDRWGCNYSYVMKVKDLDDFYRWLQRNDGMFYSRDREVIKRLFPSAVEWHDYLIQAWSK